MFAELDPKARRQALKSGLRREANAVLRTARRNIRTSGLRSRKDQKGLERGARCYMYKSVAGFKVTVSGDKKTGRGMHRNRYGDLKPVLMWAEDGTVSRRTKSRLSLSRRRRRKAHPTGTMPRYGFMARTRQQTMPGLEKNMKEMLRDSVAKTARKYGSKLL